MQRLDVQFPSGGLQCSAWLYLPASNAPAPVIVMAHGLGGTRVMRLDAFAERFTAAGYACLVFDYRHFGDSEGEPRQLLDVQKQLEDWRSALAFVRQRTEVDTQRVVLWGTSFGGGHVLSTAAADGKVAAVISQCPFTDGLASSLVLNPVSSFKVSLLAIRDVLGQCVGAKPVMVATSGLPRDAALMASHDAEEGYAKLQPAGHPPSPKVVAARFGLQIIRYYPGRRARDIQCPVLFCVCETDSVAPAAATLRHARRAPQGEIKTYADGHFDIYVGEAFERVVADQIAFLQRRVPLS